MASPANRLSAPRRRRAAPSDASGLRRVASVLPEGIKGRAFLARGTTPIEERYLRHARIFTEEQKQDCLMRHYDDSVRYTDVTAPLYAEAPVLTT